MTNDMSPPTPFGLPHKPDPLAARITLVEDEVDIAGVVHDYLCHAGHTVTLHRDGAEAMQALRREPPDLLVLDVMLPGLNGIEILRRFRQHSAAPVIMLTARIEEIDRLLALELGADDYLCKPFSPRELVARIKAILRRSGAAAQDGPDAPAAHQHGLLIDTAARRVEVADARVPLTPKEFALLSLLAGHPGRVYGRAQLLETIYAGDWDVSDRAIDSHIKNLRKKLAQASPHADDWIRSVYGIGFALELPHDARIIWQHARTTSDLRQQSRS